MSGRNSRGAASELLVAADLIQRGFAVFRSVSPAAPFDLIAAAGETLIRVEVRTVAERADGTLVPNVTPLDCCDLYAFVGTTGRRIEYAVPDDARSTVGRFLKRSERRRHVPVEPERLYGALSPEGGETAPS
jgi:hypothetical protein